MTQISTSLLAQVRQLQTVLAERDENLKSLNLEKSRLEIDAQGLTQRIRSLDESEQRYKDENWNLETQTHELIAAAKESASRDQRLQQLLAVANSEKCLAQRDLDDIRQPHGNLVEDHTAFRKAHESELGGLRKNALLFETDKSSLHRKIEELTSQNQELAKAVAGRFKQGLDAGPGDLGSEPEDFSLDRSDPEHSPPPSPSKGAVRNSLLESETLKSSLHHAHRMIQNLKGTIHREKTEKQELKRMLQEFRDELELRRNELSTSNGTKKLKTKSQHDQTKRIPRINQLGAGRTDRTDIEMTDADWEGHEGVPPLSTLNTKGEDKVTKPVGASDLDRSTDETEDAFETANERETSTETEAFQTGNESLAGGSSEDLTETESGPARQDDIRAHRSSPLPSTKRSSYISTASTSDEEREPEMKTPVQQTIKYRLKVGRGSRRSRMVDAEQEWTPSSIQDSPASSRNGRAIKGQSLFAELGGFDDEDSGDESDGIRVSTSVTSAQPNPKNGNDLRRTAIHRHEVPLTDLGMMTEPWKPALSPAESLRASMSTIEQRSRLSTDQEIVAPQLPNHSLPKIAPYLTTSRDTFTNVDAKDTIATTSHMASPPHGSDHAGIQDEQRGEGSIEDKSAPNAFTFSDIRSLEISPLKAKSSTGKEAERPPTTIQEASVTGGRVSSDMGKDEGRVGVLGSVLEWAIGNNQSQNSDDKNGDNARSSDTTALSSQALSRELSSNVAARHADESEASRARPIDMNDQSSQTMLSADDVEKLISPKASKLPARSPSGSLTLSNSMSPVLTRDTSQPSPALSPRPLTSRDVVIPAKSLKRPGSSGSVRTSNVAMPPLPSDHRQAAQQVPSKEKPEGLMGPPIAPASAYRHLSKRPHTPNSQTIQSPSSATPRARYSTARSSRSRRSSMSSFESELDARFNIRADSMPLVQGMESSTDPRMIQAITQTMIGEYLWKYTRKAGRGEMSDKRHRRFFWVHPYTRTLYWSDQDPSTAGRAQLKAKSVAIEAVRVVVDDNPMPPGLHRKSLIVITPGRDVKFTATTGQRHETWFNSLSYLLLRSGPEQHFTDANSLSPEDIAEFNPSFGRVTGSRVSLSSYNSRTNTNRQSQASSRAVSPTKGSVRRIPATPHASTASRYANTNHPSIASRFSSYWRTSKSSATNNKDSSASGSIYNASVVNDSAEDVRQVLEKQEEEADRLENVRACCDGISS